MYLLPWMEVMPGAKGIYFVHSLHFRECSLMWVTCCKIWDKLGNNYHLWPVEQLFPADLRNWAWITMSIGENTHWSASDLSLVATGANICLSCWVSGFIVLLYRLSLFGNSWIIENTIHSLDSWLTLLVSRSNHYLFGFYCGVYASAFHGMVSGSLSEHQKILSEVETTQPAMLTLRYLQTWLA